MSKTINFILLLAVAVAVIACGLPPMPEQPVAVEHQQDGLTDRERIQADLERDRMSATATAQAFPIVAQQTAEAVKVESTREAQRVDASIVQQRIAESAKSERLMTILLVMMCLIVIGLGTLIYLRHPSQPLQHQQPNMLTEDIIDRLSEEAIRNGYGGITVLQDGRVELIGSNGQRLIETRRKVVQ